VGFCDWACKNWACGPTKFEHFSKVSSAITIHPNILMAMKSSQFVYNLPGLVIQTTEYKYSISASNKICLVKVYIVPTCPVFVGLVTYKHDRDLFWYLCSYTTGVIKSYDVNIHTTRGIYIKEVHSLRHLQNCSYSN